MKVSYKNQLGEELILNLDDTCNVTWHHDDVHKPGIFGTKKTMEGIIFSEDELIIISSFFNVASKLLKYKLK